MKQRILIGLLCLIAALAVCSAVYAWFFKGVDVKPSAQYQDAKIDSKAAKVDKQEIVIKHVHVYEKEKISKTLDLPKEIAQDPKQQVTAAVDIQQSERKQSAVSILDTENGEEKIIVKEKPYPLIEFQDKKELGVRYGITTDGQAADVFGRWSFLRIKGVNVSIYGEVTTQTTGVNAKAKAMLETSYRW
jgi:hypothetical protein